MTIESPPVAAPSGLLIVGEAPGKDEEAERKPFVGQSGRLLRKCLVEQNIHPEAAYITNVFHTRPPGNEHEFFFAKKGPDVCLDIPPLVSGNKKSYLLRKFRPDYERLHKLVESSSPKLIMAVGGIPTWALLGLSGIANSRGFKYSALGTYILPTWHPAAVMRKASFLPALQSDCGKAYRILTGTEKLIDRVVDVVETREELDFLVSWAYDVRSFSFDIETKPTQMTSISFSASVDHAYVVPITTLGGRSYWTEEDEPFVWEAVKKIHQSPARKIGQNGLYDMQFQWVVHGIPVRNYSDDTLLKHHMLQPEQPRSLGFLASIYTDAPPWKHLRVKPEDKGDA